MSDPQTCSRCNQEYRRGDRHECAPNCAECGSCSELRGDVEKLQEEVAGLSRKLNILWTRRSP